MFKPNDIIVQIGRTSKWRIMEVREKTYRVELVCSDTARCVQSMDRAWLDRDFLKVNVFHWWKGEMPGDDERNEVVDDGQI